MITQENIDHTIKVLRGDEHDCPGEECPICAERAELLAEEQARDEETTRLLKEHYESENSHSH